MTFFPRVFCAVFAIAFLGLPGVARPDDTEESKGRAQFILAEAADYLASQEAFAFEAVLTYEGRFSGQEETLVTDYTVAFKRPDAISVRAVNSEMDILFVSDGKEYIRYLPAFKQFMKAEETLSAGEVVAQAGFDIIVPALALMGEMLNSAPFSSTSETGDLVFVGEETVNGIACSHIQFTFGNVAYDVWIQNDGEPMVRRFVPDMTELAQQLGANAGVDFEIQVTADLSKWESGANAEQRTHFDPPENAELVTAFRAPTPADELKGEIAPDFSIALLDGGSLTLSERKGKIVILDFWATWCGPCRVAMPVLVEVSKEFADKGVELYGVNLMEDPEQIRRYLDGQDLDLTVALDSDGAVGNQYRADGIPQTVIVGRDGKVKIVHVGLWAMPDRSAEPSATREGELQLFHDALVKSLRAELKKLVAEEGAAD